jgi:type IV pilus assembly protein PilE
MRRVRGFTLIELMVAVLVIALLTAIALPNYRQYLIRAHRSAAQSQMMAIANRQQQFLLANRTYVAVADYAANNGLNYTLPNEVSEQYDCSSDLPTPVRFTITCTGKGAQAADGPLTLNQAGTKTPADKWKR